MWYRPPGVLALSAAAVALTSMVWTLSKHQPSHALTACMTPPSTGGAHARGDSPFCSLDACIQDRFHDLERGKFGLSRMPRVHGVSGWSLKPETAAEISAVSALAEAGVTTFFYVGGRGLLKPAATEPGGTQTDWNSLRRPPSRAFSDPIWVTAEAASMMPPRPEELREHGRKALAAFATADVYTSSHGPWSIEARPVRADREDCLACHDSERIRLVPSFDEDRKNSLRIGDPLGVVIYLSAQAPR